MVVAKKLAVLYSPPLYKHGVLERGTHNSELLYLGQHLFDNGYSVILQDNFASPEDDKHLAETIKHLNPEVLIVNIWKNEYLLNGLWETIFSNLSEIKSEVPSTKIICIGSLPSLLGECIVESYPFVDAIVDQLSISSRNKPTNQILEYIKTYFSEFPKLTKEFLNHLNPKYSSDNTISLYSSRGCTKHCSFCSYNNHLRGWNSRDSADLIDDMTLFNETFGIERFALSDSNFGTNIKTNKERANAMLASKPDSLKNLRLSLNISTEGLDEELIDTFSQIGVKGIMMGIESFDAQTRKKLFSKNTDINQARVVIGLLQDYEINPILSHILFHPWLTMDKLKLELQGIESFGPHLFVHFLSASKLQIIPNTPIEQIIERSGLLLRKGIYREFDFSDEHVKLIYLSLYSYFKENYQGVAHSNNSLAALKAKEWSLAKTLVF